MGSDIDVSKTQFFNPKNQLIMRKIILAMFSIFLWSSCSDKNDVIPETEESKYRIEVSHEGNRDEFTENLVLTVAPIYINVEIGLNGGYDSVYDDEMRSKSFTYPLSNPIDREIETSSEVESVLVSIIMNPINVDLKGTLATTVRIYKNNALVKSGTHTFTGAENRHFNLSSQ